METNQVRFFVPSFVVSDTQEEKIHSWDIARAIELYQNIVQKNMRCPYGFQFLKKEKGELIAESGVYFINGKVRSYQEVLKDNKEDESVLRDNMKYNQYAAIVEVRNKFLTTMPFAKNDFAIDLIGNIIAKGSDYSWS